MKYEYFTKIIHLIFLERRIGSNKNTISNNICTMKEEPCASSSLPKLSVALDSYSSQDSSESDGFENSEDTYGEMIWNLIEGKNGMI